MDSITNAYYGSLDEIKRGTYRLSQTVPLIKEKHSTEEIICLNSAIDIILCALAVAEKVIRKDPLSDMELDFSNILDDAHEAISAIEEACDEE